jgi:hypothetical protein
MSDFPKFMYRHNPDAPVTDRLPCDIMAVGSAEQEKAAKADGWHDNVADAHPKPKKKDA